MQNGTFWGKNSIVEKTWDKEVSNFDIFSLVFFFESLNKEAELLLYNTLCSMHLLNTAIMYLPTFIYMYKYLMMFKFQVTTYVLKRTRNRRILL